MSWRPANPHMIKHGDRVRFGQGVHRVQAIATYSVPGEPDEGWVEIEVVPDSDGDALFLAWDGEAWTVSDELDDELIEGLDDVVWKGPKPPTSIELMGSVLHADEDEHHYKVKVSEQRLQPDGTLDSDRYKARVTDYVDESGGTAVSLELHEDGRSISMERPLDDAVEWLPGGAHGEG